MEENKEVLTEDQTAEELRKLKFFEQFSNSPHIRRGTSAGRSFRRGHINALGMPIHKRPFNNRANTSRRRGVHSRVSNQLRKNYYGRIKHNQ